ncbi:restriction endonuclease subunit S [Bacteroides sp.]|uniref:restriction endonuclease subunit S n=2 Tax=Bacteroidales TaxID=171549 RepID=UPI00257F1C3F|nr:restriction endonuclease subunit S [Bacteroides sp.]MBS1395803.1 restriction endonuclease subunit S [Bacteroides sp.]
MELKKYKIGDLVQVTRGASLGGEFYATQGNYVRLTCGNFDYRNNCFKENQSKDNIYYTGGFKEEFLLEKGDIITPLTEQAIGLLGSTARIPESGKYIQSQDIAKIDCNESLLDKDFAFYLISSAFVKQQLSAAAQQTKIRHTSPDKIKECTVWIPSLDIQKRIGRILTDIDNKIAINRQINDNLEAMAKQLYDYWFVQFDFPNEEGKPYKSSGGAMVWNEKLKREIPEGWNVANVFDELSVQYGFPFSTELFTEEPTSIPVVRIRDILENSVSAYSEEEVDEKYKLQKQDLLVGMDGNFHMNYWNDNVSYLNQRSVRLRAKSKSTVSIMQAKYDIAPYIKAKELRAKGSTVGHLSDKDLKELFVLVCPNIDFRNKFDSILAEIIENRCEMIELTKQRDELLPLLMNGQASVNYHLSDD